MFGTHIPETKWESATITTLDARIPKYIEKIAKRDPNGLKSRWKYLLQSIFGVAAGLVLIGVTFAVFLPGVRLLDGPKFSKINFAPLFFIMGCMTIGSAGETFNVDPFETELEAAKV